MGGCHGALGPRHAGDRGCAVTQNEDLYYARRTRLLDEDEDYRERYFADLEDRLASGDGADCLYEQAIKARAKAQPDALYDVDGEHGPSMLQRRWEQERAE